MSAPALPEEEQRELDNEAGKYTLYIHTQQYEQAQSVVTNLYQSMLDWQKKHDCRYHKGYPLHNIGYALFRQNKAEDALQYFILAYVEDLLNADEIDEADRTPAGQTLLIGYKYNPRLLELLKQKANELRLRGSLPRQPEEVLSALVESQRDYKDIQAKVTVEPRKRKMSQFDTDWDTRVFIGGSGGSVISKLRDMVDKIGGYDTVVAEDFNMPEGMTIYHKCLALLHCCKYAVFDLSAQGGQLIEIERAPDYGVWTLVVCDKDKEGAITTVPRSCLKERNISYKPYKIFEELESVFRDFLQGKDIGH